MDKKVNVPQIVYDFMNTIEKEGYEAYLVGGLIRDALFDRDNKDYDITTNMRLEDLRKIYPRLVIMKENDHRNTATIKFDDTEIEVSTFRGKTIHDDVLDRDFRINALYCDKEGNIFDEVNGISDIENKTIDLIQDDGYGFITDPLRMIRAVRFSAVLDFDLSEQTKYELETKICLLDDVARERIYSEIQKIAMSNNFSKVLKKYPDIFEYLIPHFDEMNNIRHNHERHWNETILEHTMKVIDNTKPNLVLRLAALFHDIGKTKTLVLKEDGRTSFHGHVKVSSDIFMIFAKNVKMDYDTRDAVKLLIEHHDDRLELDDKMLKRFLSKFDLDYLDIYFDLVRADILGQNPAYFVETNLVSQVEKRCKELIEEGTCLSIKDLAVDGSDLILLGFEGKEIGNMLTLLLDNIIEEELLNDKDMLIDFALANRCEVKED